MSKYISESQLLRAIESYGGNGFRVSELRDYLTETFPTSIDKNSLRRMLYGRCKSLVTRGLLIIDVCGKSKKRIYKATDKINNILSGSQKVTSQQDGEFCSFERDIQERVRKREREILLSLGATEELEELKDIYPERSLLIDATLRKLKEKNVRTLGKIEGLELLLVELQS
mgnify:CR=1 FL=1|tara:strand:- start:373 stop:885 length:513 start_codon:yes stop_codon:yes gene_type:complete